MSRRKEVPLAKAKPKEGKAMAACADVAKTAPVVRGAKPRAGRKRK